MGGESHVKRSGDARHTNKVLVRHRVFSLERSTAGASVFFFSEY